MLVGVLHALSTAWPFDFGMPFGVACWWLQMLALSVLVLTIQGIESPRYGFFLGLGFHAGLLLTGFYWLHIAMDTYGGLPIALAWGAVALLAVGLSLFGAFATTVYGLMLRRRPAAAAILFAATWLLAELARGQWFTGFGWAAAGYSHISGPLAALAPLVGAYGVGAVVAFICAAIVQVLFGPNKKSMGTALAVVIALIGLAQGANFTTGTTIISVSLLQGNIAQNEKFEDTTGIAQALAWYSSEFRAAEADLALAPETAIPVLPQQLPAGFLDGLSSDSTRTAGIKLLGIPLGNYAEGYTNSVVAVGLGAAGYEYHKHHLVPFGEFIPPMFRWFVKLMHIPLGDFNQGPLAQPSIQVRLERVAPSICFEDLFAEELAARFREVAQSPTVFANFSNLAWFGNSTAMYQHLHISQMRSLEFGRPFIRVSNTGISAIVDHTGAMVAQLQPQTRGVLNTTVQGRTGLTPFAQWCSRYGQWPLWLLAVATLAFGLSGKSGRAKRAN